MSTLSLVFAILLLIVGICGVLWSSLTKRWALFILSLSLEFKIVLFFILQTGLKYSFVLDSLKYKQDAWELAKSWITNSPIQINRINDYSKLMAGVMYLFGNTPNLCALTNIIVSTGLLFMLWRIAVEWVPQSKGYFTLTTAALYPSLNVWSVSDIKDPLFLFGSMLLIWSWIHIFLRQGPTAKKILWCVAAVAGFTMAALLRAYLAEALLFCLVTGILLCILTKIFSPLKTMAFISIGVLSVIVLISQIYPVSFYQSLAAIQHMRLTFTNLGQYDFAKSSFLLNYHLSSLSSALLFLPRALCYYLFAPFPWSVTSKVQAAALFESVPFWILFCFIFRGILRAGQVSPAQTFLLLWCAVSLAVPQAIVISNVGTLFRHRTIVILILFTFLDWNQKQLNITRPNRIEGR